MARARIGNSQGDPVPRRRARTTALAHYLLAGLQRVVAQGKHLGRPQRAKEQFD
jgi:hypothetical protein